MATQPEAGLASFSLTHVHYVRPRPLRPPCAPPLTSQDPTDRLSYICAWLALLPQALCLTYVTLIYTHREVEIMLMFAGQLACEALNWLLKRYFKEARPERVLHLGKGYGMPSSHAQFVSYFAVSVTLFLLLRHSPSAPAVVRARPAERAGAAAEEDRLHISPVYKLQMHHPRLTHALLSVGFVGLAGAVAVSRIYLSYHTPKQVVVGCVAGSAFALMWFVVTEYVRRTGWVEWLLEWRLVRSARIRDLICEHDLVEIGWQLWEDERRMRMARKGR